MSVANQSMHEADTHHPGSVQVTFSALIVMHRRCCSCWIQGLQLHVLVVDQDQLRTATIIQPSGNAIAAQGANHREQQEETAHDHRKDVPHPEAVQRPRVHAFVAMVAPQEAVDRQ